MRVMVRIALSRSVRILDLAPLRVHFFEDEGLAGIRLVQDLGAFREERSCLRTVDLVTRRSEMVGER